MYMKTLSAKYYQENKERLKKRLVMKIFLQKKKKTKTQHYGCERYKNLSEDGKQKLAEYRTKYYRMKKNVFFNYKKHLF